MKKLTAIQLAEEIFSVFENAQSIAEINPNEPVFTYKVVVNLLKKCGQPEPDMEGFTKGITDKTIPKSARIKAQISAKITRALKEKRMTQKELAEKLGKNESTISRQLSSQNLTVETMIEIQEVLGIDLLNL